MTPEERERERERLSKLWNETNGALAILRQEKRCAEREDRRAIPLLELLDAIEYELGQLDLAERAEPKS